MAAQQRERRHRPLSDRLGGGRGCAGPQGVGYYTAIAAEMVLPRGGVVGVEVDPQLAERAKRRIDDVSRNIGIGWVERR